MTNQEDLPKQIQQLTEGMARTQAQLRESQRQLDEMREQLTALQRRMAESGSTATSPTTAAMPAESSSIKTSAEEIAKAVDDLRERQEIQKSQIATHEQTKVETESKYPLKITGLLVLNGFVNTRAVNSPSTPTMALTGPGSTGASVRQTVVGIDARGPHLFGAQSYADFRVDFAGTIQGSSTGVNYTGFYNSNAMFLRFRTAHAGLRWEHTEAYFSLDRPILSPDTPTSLTAIAEPALAWSGNLWTWNPQLGVSHDLRLSSSYNLRLQTALIDVDDAPVSLTSTSGAAGTAPTLAEQSRWPGLEGRVALLGSTTSDKGSHLGVGGYFSPHLDPLGLRFNAWAGTLDLRLQLPARLSLTGNFYRGQALGGLGGGAYKDLTYRADADSGGRHYHLLDDVGGWAQLKETISERLEFNAAFGIDNVFANQVRNYAVRGGTIYQNLARNRTFTGNVIYSPSAYVLFSLEYRHLGSSPVTGPTAGSNVIGLGAGYRF